MRTKFILILLFIGFIHLRADVKSDLESYILALVRGDTLNIDAKCGMHYALLIHANWEQIGESYRQMYIKNVMQVPPWQRSLETSGGHFRLHWNDTGSEAVPPEDLDMNNIPDFIDSAAVIFENVWDFEINQLGYPPPPRQDGDPDSLYNIYFSQTYPLYGYPYWSWIEDIPSIPGLNFASYIVVDNNFNGFYSSGLEGLKVTAAHEFHHAIQLGYNVRQSDIYFFEMTSVWMEELAYPEINDYYQYLPLYFNSVSNTSFTNDNNSYANGIFLFMLEQKYDRTIVRNIWEQIKSVNSLEAISSVLSSTPYNSSWLETLSEFGEWLYYTGERNIPGRYFKEADKYPQLRIRSSDRIDLQGGYNENAEISSNANRFYIVDDTLNSRQSMTVSGSSDLNSAVRLIEPGMPGALYMINNPISLEQVSTSNFGLVLTNSSESNQSISLSISTDAGSEISLGPNPVKSSEGQTQVVFRNIPGEADIYIFDVIGKKIAHIPSTGTSVRFWELKNEKGKSVATGIYLVLIRGGGVEKIKKLSILR
jgi:hypothetical protein